MKLVIRNFQSIAAADLEIEGLTIITGKSNLGKSAVRRAIEGACFGRPGDEYIKNGNPQCGVAFADNGLVVKWRKVRTDAKTTTRNTNLEINGTVYTKIGKEQGDLLVSHGIKEIRVKDLRIRPQFAGQHDAIFLLTNSETQIAELLKQLGRVDVVTEAQRLAKKDLKDAETSLKTRELDRQKAELEAKELEGVPILRYKYDQELKILVVGMKARTESKKVGINNLQKLPTLLPSVIPGELTIPVIPDSMDSVRKLKRLLSLDPWKIPEEVIVSSPPNFTDLLKVRRLAELGNELALLAGEIGGLETNKSDLLQQKKDAEKELGKCPLCERDFQ